MRGIMAMVAMSLALAGPAFAQRLDPELKTAGDLLTLCGPDEDMPRRNQRLSYCEGFIAGTGLLYLELRASGLIKSPWACNDTTPSADAVRMAYVTWARANPQAMSETATSGFWRAMAETYRCPGSPSTTRP